MKRIFKYCKFVCSLSHKFFIINILYNILMSVAWIMINFALKLLTESIVFSKDEYIIISLGLPIFLYFVCAILLGGSFYNLEQIIHIKFIRKSIKQLVLDFSKIESNIKHDLFYDSEFYDEYLFAKKNQHKIIEITTLIMNNALIALFNVIFSALSIIYFDGYIFVFLLFVSVVSFALNNYIAKKNFNNNKSLINIEREVNYLNSLLIDRVNSKEIRSFGMSSILLLKWKTNFDKYSSQKKSLNKKNNIISSLVVLCELVMNYVFIIYLIYLVINTKITASDAVFLQGTFWVLNYGINTLIILVSKDIYESLKYITDYDLFVEKNYMDVSNEIEKISSDSIIGEFKNLEVKNVSYKYPHSKKYALRNVNLNFKKGEIICLIGDNGSGKSTLSKILCGLLDDYSGEIFINNINIKNIDKKVLYSYFAIVFQEFNKYCVSLKDNILIGNIEKNDDYSSVIEKVHLREFINELPDKDDTILGKEYSENGTDLSLGQWQRIIMARAYIKNANILVLDEPTASIDPQEELRLVSSFKDLISKSSAVLLITHRIGFAKMSSKINVMKNGAIVETGSHEELLNIHGEYFRMFQRQKHLYEQE